MLLLLLLLHGDCVVLLHVVVYGLRGSVVFLFLSRCHGGRLLECGAGGLACGHGRLVDAVKMLGLIIASGDRWMCDLLSLDLRLTWCRAEGGGVLDLWMRLGLVLLGGLVGGNSS